MKGPTAQSDKEWQAECDARSLAETEEIKSDGKRLSAAKKAAKKLLKDRTKEVKSLRKIAKPIAKPKGKKQ